MPPRQRREASAERLQTLLTKTFEDNPAITSVNDLRDFAMEAEKDSEAKVKPTYAEATEFLGSKERSQVHKEVKQEWKGRIRKPLRAKVSFAIDDLDWRTISPMTKEQKGYEFMLCCLDRGTRKLYVRALATKTSQETVAMLRDILQEAGATDTIKDISFDSASEYLSAEMREFLSRIGGNENGVTTHVKPPVRESRQDIADLDSQMGIFSRHITLLRKKAEPETLAWYPYILPALECANKKAHPQRPRHWASRPTGPRRVFRQRRRMATRLPRK